MRFGNYTGCYKDTYFNATFNHPDSRALLVDSNKVRIYLAEVLGAPQTSKYDMIVILVNDVKYGGSGGGVAVMATYSPTQSYVLWQYNTLHEIGHHFAGLGDEYGTREGTNRCYITYEFQSIDISSNLNSFINRPLGTDHKWSYWVGAYTPVPTTSPWYIGSSTGVFEGGYGCDYNVWRPSYANRMRNDARLPFNEPSMEEIVRRIYALAPIVATSQPTEGTTVTVSRGQTQTFSVTPLAMPLTHGFRAAWYVDGEPEDSGLMFNVATHNLSPGNHSVSVTFYDPTTMVRRDYQNRLTKTLRWNLNVLNTPVQPNAIDDARVFVRQHYRDFLTREPDGSGWDFWTREITNCGSNPGCIDVKRDNVSASFFLSPEFQNTGYYIYRMYKGGLGRMPRFTEFVEDMQAVTGGIVVNNALSPTTIERN